MTPLRVAVARARFRTPRPRRCSARSTSTPTTDYLLLQEHPHVYTLGSSAKPEHVLRDPASVGAELVHADRGGDVTYHGPGQLVGYPIISLAEWQAGQRDVVAYVRKLEDVLIAVLRRLRHRRAARSPGYTGVWVGDEKIAAIGVRVVARPHPARLRAERRSRPLDVRAHRPVRHPRPRRHVDGAGARPPGRDARRRRPRRRAVRRGVRRPTPRTRRPAATVAWRARPGRAAAAGVEIALTRKRPEWMRVRARFDDEYLELKQLARDLDLHTVCEEAGCPNIYECWADRTATFMILGDRCTRACGFCQVDTRKPLAARRSTSRDGSPTRSPRSASRTR